jgi:hypothetical protein
MKKRLKEVSNMAPRRKEKSSSIPGVARDYLELATPTEDFQAIL